MTYRDVLYARQIPLLPVQTTRKVEEHLVLPNSTAPLLRRAGRENGGGGASMTLREQICRYIEREADKQASAGVRRALRVIADKVRAGFDEESTGAGGGQELPPVVE